MKFEIGQKINHPKFGEGEVIELPNFGYHVKVKFKTTTKDFIPSNLAIVLNRNTPGIKK